jgi:hypothetical protein
MTSAEQAGPSLLRYPARMQSLVLIAYVCFSFYILLFISIFSYVLSEGAPFYWLGIFALYILLNIVFEFGQEIIASSFNDRHEIPVISFQWIDRGRFSRQLIMTAFFGSIIFGLYQNQLNNVALAVFIFVLLILPASLTINAIFEDLLEIINPRTLLGFIAVIKFNYLGSLAWLGVLTYIFYTTLEMGFGAFSIVLPFWLYLCLMFFRHLGLVALHHKGVLLPEQDFDIDKKEIEQHYSDSVALHAALEKAYWGLKEGQIEEAINIVGPIIRTNNWARFDAVFEFISAWPTKIPATHFVADYLPTLRARAASFKALDLCQWCLKQDKHFAVENTDVLEYLISESISPDHYRVVIKLVENFVAADPGHSLNKKLLTKAADISQAKLHQQVKFEELRKKLDSLESD